jgi:hypothetical protein
VAQERPWPDDPAACPAILQGNGAINYAPLRIPCQENGGRNESNSGQLQTPFEGVRCQISWRIATGILAAQVIVCKKVTGLSTFVGNSFVTISLRSSHGWNDKTTNRVPRRGQANRNWHEVATS